MTLTPPFSTRGRDILDGTGQPIKLVGVNWGGAHQNGLVPAGLDKLHRSQIIQRIVDWQLNCVRFPFALGTFVNADGSLKTGVADSRRLAANQDLVSAKLTPWGVYQRIVDDMTAAGLYVILNCHLLQPGWCCSDADGNGLWYNSNWPSSTFSNTWFMVARRFASNPLVGYDLKNEPRKATVKGTVITPTWGDGVWASDFRRSYQWHADQIHGIDPDALIFCEGLSYAGDLTKAGSHPVTGRNIVYEMHDYSWYHPSGQSQAAYITQMDANGGYLVKNGTAPLWIGEFGQDLGSRAAITSGWMANFFAWAKARNVGVCWWQLSAQTVLGIEPTTNVQKAPDGNREGFGLMAGQDWLGSNTEMISLLRTLM